MMRVQGVTQKAWESSYGKKNGPREFGTRANLVISATHFFESTRTRPVWAYFLI